MIDKSNFKAVLNELGFIPTSTSKNVMEKKFPKVGAVMKVDFDAEKLIYPDEIAGRTRDDNFSKNEFFVMFECVCRLLEKGYRPEHIELEKMWQLGHEPKGGRSDICVYDGSGEKVLCIIECKQWGSEYSKALKATQKNGDQLFSYWQQEGSCEWLALYASDFSSGKVEYDSLFINCLDDFDFKVKTGKSVARYTDAKTAKEKFEVWRDTYSFKTEKNLFFLATTVAYVIGKSPLRKGDLKDFDAADKIVEQFETILRDYNVSDRENAFNRLTALFICKLTDEHEKVNDSDEVDFVYNVGTDTYESLQDRLQDLYNRGMEKFMQEDIFCVKDDYAKNLFEYYIGSKRDKAIKNLDSTLRKYRYYTNNDFAFIEVHNERLFQQNAEILIKVVQLFQEYRIINSSRPDILGNMFELLLNKGFKQNEGQFFTPIPIARFMWNSLPVDAITHRDGQIYYPKVIDYACGAGHFLTEGVKAIDDSTGGVNNSWTEDCIFGIEKDYRLARVSKISLFMNGAGDGNIIYGDGLESDPKRKIDNGTFDVLIANPPYSVAGFKKTLSSKIKSDKAFELLDRISDNSSEIEVLFVERIAQLLKPKGVAAVILPSSILNNTSLSYIGARENILKNFNIRAIVELGQDTFQATSTNTVILFLEKFNAPPRKTEIIPDSVDAIMDGIDLSDWEDQDIFKSYLAQIDVDESAYNLFLKKKYSLADIENDDYFGVYFSYLESSKDVAKLLRKCKTDAEKDMVRYNFLYEHILNVEREKIFYFSLVYRQKTVLISAPESKTETVEFRGYKWSNAKGNQGIMILQPGGMLYNDSDRRAPGTYADVIKNSFSNIYPSLSGDQIKYASYVDTKDLFNFTSADFSKILAVQHHRKEIKSKFPIVPMGVICDIELGATPSTKCPEYYNDGHNLFLKIGDMKGETVYDTDVKITDVGVKSKSMKPVPVGTVLLGFKLSISKTAIAGRELYTNEAIAALLPKDSAKVKSKYLFYIFKGDLLDLSNMNGHKAFGASLNKKILQKDVKIPIPPISTQDVIIKNCEKLDYEYRMTRMSDEEYKTKISDIFKAESIFEAP